MSTVPPPSPNPHLPEAPERLGLFDRLFQNGEFQRLRNAARAEIRPLNEDHESLKDLINESGAPGPVPARIPDANEISETEFIDDTNDAGTNLLSYAEALESISVEHRQPHNVNKDAWFNGTETSTGVSGRILYQNVRQSFIAELGDLQAICAASDVPEAVGLGAQAAHMLAAVQALIEANGDFPSGHMGIQNFCAAIRAFVTHLDDGRATIQARRDARLATPVAAASAPHVTNDPALVARYRASMASISRHLGAVSRNEFWYTPELRVEDNDIAALAGDLVRRLPAMSPENATADVMVASEVETALETLTDAMRAQLRVHQSRPSDFRLERDKNVIQKTASVIRDAYRSKYRNVALAGTVGLVTVTGIAYNYAGRDTAEPAQQTQSAGQNNNANPPTTNNVPANPPVQSNPNTTNQPSAPMRVKGRAELGKGSVEVQGDNFVFNISSSVKVAQAWVGKPGEEPVRLSLQIVNGKAVFQIPVEFKTADWIGVQLDTFESGAWNKGTFQRLQLK